MPECKLQMKRILTSLLAGGESSKHPGLFERVNFKVTVEGTGEFDAMS